MEDELDTIAGQISGKRNYDTPPLQLWHPPLSGDIAIRIDAQGRWFHDGGEIRREALVRLFASILRREEDGDYYLVTPVEKWRIKVELHPLMVTDVDSREEGGKPCLDATLNTGRVVRINQVHPLVPEPAVGNIAVLKLDKGLTALFSRAAWYRLVDMVEASGDALVVRSGESVFELPAG